MLYTFGDSFTHGVNFFPEERPIYTWPNLLSKKINLRLLDFSLGASSNWRTARILNKMNFNKDDVVIIAFTDSTRIEIGVNENHAKMIQSNHNNFKVYPSGAPIDLIECEDERLYSRRLYHAFNRANTIDEHSKYFSSLLYDKFYNTFWFEEMFRVMFYSISKKLETSGCKWICFNTWCPTIIDSNFAITEKNYLFGSSNFINNLIKPNDSLSYWSKQEHEKVCNTILENLHCLYGA